MHELSLAQNIAEQVCQAVQESSVEQVTLVRLKIGELSGVSADALQSCWEVVRSDSILQSSELVIETVPVTIYCPVCRQVVAPREPWDLACVACGQFAADVRSGRELEIVSLECI